jgi:23S rRNA (adenine2503-C2)-methyltransferase
VADVNLYGMDRERLTGLLGGLGARGFHTGQLYRWLYARHRLRPDEWTDFPKTLRRALETSTVVDPGRIDDRVEAPDGTVKYRVALPGGGAVEAVYMIQGPRVTLCLSSQVGCALACDFCLTGTMGLGRHLDAGEIAGQAALIREDRGLVGQTFNVVFMGMGEPLHNYDAVLAAFRLLTDPDGFGLSRRRVTVSTVGMVRAIERLAEEPRRPRLAVSLNATTNRLRDRLMPINRRFPLETLVAALRRYAERTGDAFTFEYVLLDGVNTADADIDRLAALARGLPVKVNLIPFNEVPGRLPYRAPARGRVEAIRDRLLGLHVATSIRWSRGADARAACGQLALLGEEDPR